MSDLLGCIGWGLATVMTALWLFTRDESAMYERHAREWEALCKSQGEDWKRLFDELRREVRRG